MKSDLSVKMLVALALVLLAFGATEGRTVSKCELKEQLEAAQIPVIRAMGNKMTVDELVAKIVCMASASGFNTSYVKAIAAKPKAPVIRRLYGVFQLSDQWACDSGLKRSLNVCNMRCTALTDDDITDDIACLKTVISSIKPKPKYPRDFFLPLTTLDSILVKDCRYVVASRYFAECPAATAPQSETTPPSDTQAGILLF